MTVLTSFRASLPLPPSCRPSLPALVNSLWRAAPAISHGVRAVATAASSVTLSRQRINQLLEGEITHFALKAQRPLDFQQIINIRNIQETARFLHAELPVRFANRIRSLEELPGWRSIPALVDVRTSYVESFKDLRLVAVDDRSDFRAALQRVKQRHGKVVQLLTTGLRDLQHARPLELSPTFVDAFLNEFFLSRIGTELIREQYMTVERSNGRGSGIIDPECAPLEVITRAARDAGRLCDYHTQSAPTVQLFTPRLMTSPLRFAFVSRYLYYVVFELLKNSMRAVSEKGPAADESDLHSGEGARRPTYELEGTNTRLPPVRVVLAGDSETMHIKVSDRGGGIPLALQPKIWSYLYTTATPAHVKVSHTGIDGPATTNGNGVPPLAGFGVGLPLSNLYTQYFGGRLRLVSLPGFGTDAYVQLPGLLGNVQEKVARGWEPIRAGNQDANAAVPSYAGVSLHYPTAPVLLGSWQERPVGESRQSSLDMSGELVNDEWGRRDIIAAAAVA
ncbi:unnamed protein product [Vitrella brassicaformis CCMP3155]|uniref:Protein-serine/threonine kinase n=2 Tax=Vitrella brassicaformis TaxID=1169539 RepID=A0A0G4E865_VITBC|nr:unnamed protein product [Vitrella brassicaformis CCMP3155]|mmetsp:Transcript_7563/g.21666  ORF Transcript_7563/g.21666 Transcript_7563/m.21666 type:complete len:507 (-) Transcript_7563:67-1587(-)|eukprot:CEL91698.1 unnamed protein product [Vitrella brassicaformis CCMP3155]